MKKIFQGIALVATLVLGTGAATAAVTKTPITIGDNSFTFGTQVNTTYYYTPASDGLLTFNTNSGNTAFLYPAWSSADDEPAGNSLVPVESSGTTHTFEVTGGVTYYCWDWSTTMTVTSTSFVADTTTGSFSPLVTAELVLGQQYTSSSTGWGWATDGGISGPTRCYTYTPNANGTLVMEQSSPDTHIYSVKWNMKSDFQVYSNVLVGGYPNGTAGAPYPMSYQLEGGKTYYIYFKNEAADATSYFTATFTASGEEIKDAELDVPFNAYNAVWKYVPEVTGVMTVQQSTSFFGLAGTQNSFVYTSSIHSAESQILPMSTVISDDNSWQFLVTAGQPVYFYQNTTNSTEFTITSVVEQTTPVVTFTSSQPAPGEGGLDDYSYVGGIMVNLSPVAGVNVGSALFQYQSAVDGQWVSKELSLEQTGSGSWLIIGVRDYYIEAMQGAAKPASMCQVVLNGITLQGKVAETVSAENSSYVQCNGNSITIQYYIPDEYGFQLSKAVWPQVIYQTWPEDGQSNGIATLIFNNNIKAVNSVTMVYGTHYWGASSGESVDPSYIIPYDIDGNTLTLDFTAAYEDPEAGSPDSTKSYSQVTVFVNGIMNEYGILWGEDGMNTLTEYIQYNSGEAPQPVATMDQAMVYSPEDGNTYAIDSEFQGFVLSYWDAEDGGLSFANASENTVELYIGGTKEGNVTATIDGNQLKVDLGDQAGKNTEYMIWVPQGLVKNAEGLLNAGQGVSCKVLEVNDQYTLSPADGAELTGDVITVSYPNSTLLVNKSAPVITWANNRYMGNVTVAGDKFEIPIDLSVMEKGSYDLIIPATYFVINADSLNPEITATYYVTTVGVTADFVEDNGVYTVYNLNGVKVLETADKSELNLLGKGFYVINGKKVLVK